MDCARNDGGGNQWVVSMGEIMSVCFTQDTRHTKGYNQQQQSNNNKKQAVGGELFNGTVQWAFNSILCSLFERACDLLKD